MFYIPIEPKDEDIFIDDVDTLVRQNYSCYEGQHPLFKKFGERTGGINDTWIYTKDWPSLPEVEKWKYVAFCALYWEAQYKYRYDQENYYKYKEQVKKWSEQNPEFLKTLKILEEKEKQINE